MNFNGNQQDLETVFNQRWKANNYNQNGMKEKIEQQNNHFNKMFNIKPKEEQRKEILKANSIEGRLERLEQSMKSLSNMNNKNNF